MDDIMLESKIKAANIQGWSEGYIEGLIVAYKYIKNNASYVDDKILNELKEIIKLCGGKL